MTAANSFPSAPEQTAVAFVDQELIAAQKSLKKTRITTAILVLAVVSYSVGITTWMSHNVLEPRSAADIATARAVDVVQQSGSALSDQVVQQLPPALASLPDMVLDQLPRYRAQLEDKFEQALADYGHELEPEAEIFLDTFIAENKEHVAAILGAAQDPKLTKHFGDQLEKQLMSYLETPNNKGESVMEMLDQGRIAMEDIQGRLHRLAHAKDLTPEELKLRRVVASAMKSADVNL